MIKTILLFAALAFLSFGNQAQTVTDYDGNEYNTVIIGTQKWFVENLKTTSFNDGVTITNIEDTSWIHLTTPAYAWYDNAISNKNIYGGLYNWYAVNTGKLCPTGWHVPSDANWITLFNSLGGDSVAIKKLKEAGTTHWNNPNYGTNESGFTALPGGFREFAGGEFFGIGNKGAFWSTTVAYPSTAWGIELTTTIHRLSYSWTNGLSVRCLCDTAVSRINEINMYPELRIYPNPAIDKVIIDYSGQSDIKMQVYNMIGELMLQEELHNNNNEIDISTLSTGLYIIKVSGADWTVQKKLIKE